jgi:hypothetical protein
MPTFLTKKKYIYTVITALLTFITSTSSFAAGADNEITNTADIMSENVTTSQPVQVLILAGNKNIETPFDDILRTTPFIPIARISKPIVFKKGLFITDYNRLLREQLIYKYPKAFQNKIVNTMFFRALAELTYSNNGRLEAEFFNDVVAGREKYFAIRQHIEKLNFKPLIKKAIMYLYLKNTIYFRDIKDQKVAIETLSKIPKNPVLYIIDPPEFLLRAISEQKSGFISSNIESSNENLKYSRVTEDSDKNLPSNIINFELGDNLYFICSNFYSNFTTLPPEKQLEILKSIYEFNLTLTTTRPIRADYSLLTYLEMQFHDIKKDHFLKYRLKANTTWLLLPSSLNIYKNSKESKNND